MTKLTVSMENYLEKILLLEKKHGEARVTDIAIEMSIAKSSVHTALHTLEDKGYLTHEKYGALKLSEKGIKAAEEIYRKHTALTQFFEKMIGVDSETAEEDACAIEHVISEKSMDRIIQIMKDHNS